MKRRSPSWWAFVVAAASMAAATAASAADLPVPAAAPSYYPPFPVATYNWTGFYLGFEVGGADVQDRVTQLATTSLLPAGAVTNIVKIGPAGGGQVGADWQFGSWLLGVEGSFVGVGAQGSGLTGVLTAPFVLGERSTDDLNWYATATARAGFAINTVLLYAKGGAAWENERYQQATIVNPVASVGAVQTISSTRTGFVVGGGVEYGMLEHLSFRMEYDFMDFGTRNYNFGTILPQLVAAGFTVTSSPLPVSIRPQTHVLMFGVNYRFN